MADTEKTPAMLLDELAALDPAQRREVATTLRQVAEAFAEMPDGRHTAHTNQHAAAAGKLSDILDRLRKGSGQGRRGGLRAVR